MDRKKWSSRLFMAGCFALVALILINNLVLVAHPPGRSWPSPGVFVEEVRFQVTFQVDPGDRMTIDLGKALNNLGFQHFDSYRAYLVETPRGTLGTPPSLANPIQYAQGELVRVDTPQRAGIVLDPDPPRWTHVAEEWVTLVIFINHGGRAPDGSDAKRWYGTTLQTRLLSDGPFGPKSSPYQVLSGTALAAQPWFYALQSLAIVAIATGGLGTLISRRKVHDGLEEGVSFAMKARSWLDQLSTQLWLSGAGILLLAILIALLQSAGEFTPRPELAPDGWYSAHVTLTLGGTFLVASTAWVIRLLNVRKAIRRVPDLDLDA